MFINNVFIVWLIRSFFSDHLGWSFFFEFLGDFFSWVSLSGSFKATWPVLLDVFVLFISFSSFFFFKAMLFGWLLIPKRLKGFASSKNFCRLPCCRAYLVEQWGRGVLFHDNLGIPDLLFQRTPWQQHPGSNFLGLEGQFLDLFRTLARCLFPFWCSDIVVLMTTRSPFLWGNLLEYFDYSKGQLLE